MFMYIEYIVSSMADIFHWYDKSISDLISDFADKKAVEGFDILYIYTSSNAQGGGGSFKNRKPIGEIGCCESRMPDQKNWQTVQLTNWLIDLLTDWLTS